MRDRVVNRWAVCGFALVMCLPISELQADPLPSGFRIVSSGPSGFLGLGSLDVASDGTLWEFDAPGGISPRYGARKTTVNDESDIFCLFRKLIH